MRIFVNNVDGFLAGAICADLSKISNHIIGTRKGPAHDLVPPMVDRTVPRIEVRKLLKTVAQCDVVIYDLHDADLEELEMVVAAIQNSSISHDLVFILISSVGVWAHTQRSYEDLPLPAASSEGCKETPAAVAQRPVALRPEEYIRRVPAPKFLEWKAMETQVLAMRCKGTVHPYVVCSGIPYGNGEEAFLGLMKAAWQTKDTLRVIGDGGNFLPLVHVRDCARLVRHVLQIRPSLEYHVAVDRGDVTQRALIRGVAEHYRLPYTPTSVSVAEALLAELADIMTMDLRLEPSPLMGSWNYTDGTVTLAPGKLALLSLGASLPRGDATSSSFRWWCEEGFLANMEKVSEEFRLWRQLDPVHICIIGPPGSAAGRVGAEVAKHYAIAQVDLDEIIEENRNLDTPLGQQLRQELDAIAAALANPKSQGPFLMGSGTLLQLVETALKVKALQHRGFVLSGFPQTAEEAGKLPEGTNLDLVMSLSSKDAMCLTRLQALERPMPEKEFQIRMDRWKKETEGEIRLGESLAASMKCGFVEADVDPASGTDAERQSLSGPDPQEEAFEKTVRAAAACIASRRSVQNFIPQNEGGAKDQAADLSSTKEKDKPRKAQVAHASSSDPVARKEEEAKLQKQREEQQRVEQIRKDELVKLEKHSEPLRQYLMHFIVPALTSGLVEVCQEMPNDPVGYLSEYLSVYSEAKSPKSEG